MDYDEFEQPKTSIDTDVKRSDEIEFVIEQLNHMAHAGGRYSREVQLPIAIRIVERLKG